MGITKSEVFSKQVNELADFGKAIAHPARVAILQYLTEHDACVCGELVDVLPLSQSTISQHLKELKRIGIITGEVEGPKVCYCINLSLWNRALERITVLFKAHRKCC